MQCQKKKTTHETIPPMSQHLSDFLRFIQNYLIPIKALFLNTLIQCLLGHFKDTLRQACFEKHHPKISRCKCLLCKPGDLLVCPLTVHVVLLAIPPQTHGDKSQQDEHHHSEDTAHDQVQQPPRWAGGVRRVGVGWGDGVQAGRPRGLTRCSGEGGEDMRNRKITQYCNDRMQTIVVALVKVSTFTLCNYATLKLTSFSENMPGLLINWRFWLSHCFLPLVSQIMTLLYSLSPPSLKHCILISQDVSAWRCPIMCQGFTPEEGGREEKRKKEDKGEKPLPL